MGPPGAVDREFGYIVLLVLFFFFFLRPFFFFFSFCFFFFFFLLLSSSLLGNPKNQQLIKILCQLPPVALSPSFSLLDPSNVHGAWRQKMANHGMRLLKLATIFHDLQRIFNVFYDFEWFSMILY